MRKLIVLLFVMVMVLAVTATAFAITPTMKVPDMPDLSKLSLTPKVELPGQFWINWFTVHPFRIWIW